MFSLETILSLVRKHQHRSHLTRIEMAGLPVRIGTRRLRTFAEKGTVCLGCGLHGLAFELVPHLPTRDNTRVTHHSLQLYGVKEGERVWMTRDHIRAQSLGGLDTVANSQPLCLTCNRLKSIQESRVLVWLRQTCGLNAHGVDATGKQPLLTQALMRVHLGHAWQEVQDQWNWQSQEPVERQLERLMGRPSPAFLAQQPAETHSFFMRMQRSETGQARWNTLHKDLVTLCQILEVTPEGYREGCEERAQRDAGLKLSSLPCGLAAAMGYSDKGFTVFMNDRATLHDAHAGEAMLHQRWACRHYPGRLLSPSNLALSLARLEAQAKAYGLTATEYRARCEEAGTILPHPHQPLTAVAHQMGLSEAGVRAFWKDENYTRATGRTQWLHQHAPPRVP